MMTITAGTLESIVAEDLRSAAAAALAAGDEVLYSVSQVDNATYTGPCQVLVVADRAGVVTNANAQWGDVHDGIITIDETGEQWATEGEQLRRTMA